ncbi:eukaryotic aspartyl protease family protein [Striga asiatica]|uniref:Eukaryotic aspartyl protease family protein n=1 Tax=Striga asiatica TaxID=4170 RepID=A0A5A7PN97_STRAF|nr:eukaryotic aspartyl protease family protein [Striga asiatica]
MKNLMLTTLSECNSNSNTCPTVTVTIIHRDYSNSLSSAQTPPPSPTISNTNGTYLIKYSIGSLSTSGNPDTASDLIWAPCSSRDSFSMLVPCTDTICDDLTNCKTVRNKCQFRMQYGSSSVAGDLFADTIKFDDGTSASNIKFGCDYSGYKFGNVGLGRGELSLVNQLGPGSFSYCLVLVTNTKTKSSKMSFGSHVTGDGVVSDMLVDTGKTLTVLPPYLYDKLNTSVTKWATQEAKLTPVPPPPNSNLDSCFSPPNKDLSAIFPGVAFYMGGGKAVTLGYNNVLLKTGPTPADLSLCLMVKPSTDGRIVYGNLAQADFLVGIDLVQNAVSFKKTTCG